MKAGKMSSFFIFAKDSDGLIVPGLALFAMILDRIP